MFCPGGYLILTWPGGTLYWGHTPSQKKGPGTNDLGKNLGLGYPPPPPQLWMDTPVKTLPSDTGGNKQKARLQLLTSQYLIKIFDRHFLLQFNVETSVPILLPYQYIWNCFHFGCSCWTSSYWRRGHESLKMKSPIFLKLVGTVNCPRENRTMKKGY